MTLKEAREYIQRCEELIKECEQLVEDRGEEFVEGILRLAEAGALDAIIAKHYSEDYDEDVIYEDEQSSAPLWPATRPRPAGSFNMKVRLTVDFGDLDRLAIAASEDGKRKATYKEMQNFMFMAVNGTLEDKVFDYNRDHENDNAEGKANS